jgi:pimeloyl-ACP methyl ester carboxylesterase
MTSRRDYSLQIQGLTLYVTEWGDLAARPVIMLHGIRGYAETFASVAESLQPQRRVIAFDQRGRGRSDWDPARNYYTDAYVADLEAVRAALGIDSFDLLGHSMGGISALVYAAERPTCVSRMVIEDAGPGAFENSQGAQRIQRELAEAPASFPDWEAASAYMRELRPRVSEAARQERLRSMLKPVADGGFTWCYDHAGIAATRLSPDVQRVPDLVSAVRAVRCPTLVLRGGRSDYLQPEMAQAMARLNPRIQWREIPDAGHYVHDDQHEAFCREVREFLCD